MKLIAIGDLHGRDVWKQIDESQFDKIIFTGDYVDSKNISTAQIIENLEYLIICKKLLPDKIVLLLGNHDIQYSEYPRYRGPGFSCTLQPVITKLFRDNSNFFQVAFQIGTYLFTHAGLSDAYVQLNLKSFYDAILRKEVKAADLLNQIHKSENQFILHTIGPARNGNDHFGGITWADYQETRWNPLPGYHQVVGHSRVGQITTEGDNHTSVTYIDVLDTETKFFEVEI
jgi:predicted MPP superfamily phosphohydrolase